MKSCIGARWVVGVAFLTMVVGLVAADKDPIRTKLTGLEETTMTINTPASGEFKATISEDGTSIKMRGDLAGSLSTVTQSHIHFGRPGLAGGIMLVLCFNPVLKLPLTSLQPAGVPMPQPCPLRPRRRSQARSPKPTSSLHP